MARPTKCRCICSKPRVTQFVPEEVPAAGTITIGYDEYEALRLIDHVGLTQEQCARKMNVSRTTVTRMYDTVRSKIAQALVQGMRLQIDGGDVIVCAAPRPECANEPDCCHRKEPVST